MSEALEAMHEEEALGKAYDLRLMVRLWRWVAPYRWQVGATLALIQDLPFTYLHVFPFSVRPDAAAARLPGQQRPEVIRERAIAFDVDTPAC